MLGGLLLTVGLLTPIVAALIGCGATAFAFFLTPFCTFTIFEGNLSVIFGAVILLGVVLLGPVAFSLDARIFGRREIIIPPASFRRP